MAGAGSSPCTRQAHLHPTHGGAPPFFGMCSIFGDDNDGEECDEGDDGDYDADKGKDDDDVVGDFRGACDGDVGGSWW